MTGITKFSPKNRTIFVDTSPEYASSGDLESATKTITATSEPGSADYTASVTTPNFNNSAFTALRQVVRLQITIDSWTGAGAILNYRIKKGGVSIATGQIATAAATGAKYAAVDVTTGTLTGSASYTVYLWVDADTCVISVCQLWVAIGTCSTSYVTIASISGYGKLQIGSFTGEVAGSGSATIAICTRQGTANWDSRVLETTGVYGKILMLAGTQYIGLKGSVATDVNAIYNITAALELE